jgi:CRISPR-associated exonuclease Cas4
MGNKIMFSNKHPRIRGTQINYYFICKTKLWLFSHSIQMEQESENVSMGKLLHKKTYGREKKDVTIDNLISVDFIRRGDYLELHEVKKTPKMEDAHRYQLLYYIYYLKHEKGIEKIRGSIDYPKMRKKESVELDETEEIRLKEILNDIEKIINGNVPEPGKMKICRRCAYYEFCWV